MEDISKISEVQNIFMIAISKKNFEEAVMMEVIRIKFIAFTENVSPFSIRGTCVRILYGTLLLTNGIPSQLWWNKQIYKTKSTKLDS